MVEKEGKDRLVLSRGPWADPGRMMDQASTFWVLEVAPINGRNVRAKMNDIMVRSLHK